MPGNTDHNAVKKALEMSERANLQLGNFHSQEFLAIESSQDLVDVRRVTGNTLTQSRALQAISKP